MSGERMRAEMAEQPDALQRLAESFDDQVTDWERDEYLEIY